MSGPHDRFVKRVLANPAHAAAELASILPTQLVARVDWSSLESQKTSFIDEQLQGRFADLVFTARIDQREGVIYVLWEHQSSNDPLIVFRMLGYMVRIWDNLVRENPGLD
jgi:predicted transposase/invertase (TIGR01784 family)